MNMQITSANTTANYSNLTALALAKAGWKVERIAHKGDKKFTIFVGPNGVKEERLLERGYPALEEYIKASLPKKPAPKKVLRTFGNMRPGKTARDHASHTRGANPTGHSAIAGPQKGATGSKPQNKGGSKGK